MGEVIRTDELGKRYGDILAVDDLSLRVGRGEIYAFLGLNGAGKTTTIRMLLGMARPTSGRIDLFGRPLRRSDPVPWSRVGSLVETPHAYPQLTVRENLEAMRRLRRLADRGAVERVIEQLGLAAVADRAAGELSLGNAQRLGLAKALLHEPELLILDEPANGLDPEGVVEVRELLRGLAREQGATIFLSSHVLGEVARLATRIGVIHHARLIEESATAELLGHSNRRLVVDCRDRAAAAATLNAAGFAVDPAGEGMLELRSERAIEEPERVARLLVEAGTPPTRLAVEQDDLETHFLRLVAARDWRRAA